MSNISDTLNNLTETYQKSSPKAPVSEVYELSDEQVKRRKIVKSVVWTSLFLIIGFLIYKQQKK